MNIGIVERLSGIMKINLQEECNDIYDIIFTKQERCFIMYYTYALFGYRFVCS